MCRSLRAVSESAARVLARMPVRQAQEIASFDSWEGRGIHTMAKTSGKVVSCRAAVAWAAMKPVTVEIIEVAPPQAHEVRVRILYTSVCQTDLSFLQGKIGAARFWPRIFGHEGAGIVESVGEGVTEFKEGDHVIPVYQGECSDCTLCKSTPNICVAQMSNRQGYIHPGQETRFYLNGKPVYHFFNTSTFSEYTVVHEVFLAKVNPEAPLDKILLLGCGVSTGYGAVWKSAEVKAGSTVAVFGLGTVGLAVVEAAAKAGASRIIGIDINPKKFAIAKDFGLTDSVNPKDFDKPVQEVIKDLVPGGVLYSFECVGSNEALLTSAIECCNPILGTATLVGAPANGQKLVCDPTGFFSGLRVRGVMFGGYRGKTDVPELVEMYMRKELDVDKFVTDTLPFSRISEAFDMLATSGSCLRCVLDYSS